MTIAEAKKVLKDAQDLDKQLEGLSDNEGFDIVEKAKALRKSVRDFGKEAGSFIDK